MNLMAESTGLFSMGTFIIGKVLTWSFMTCEACIFYITRQVQCKWFMGIGVAAQAILQFKMGPVLMTHGTLRNNIFSPGRMLSVAIKTGNCCLVFSTTT